MIIILYYLILFFVLSISGKDKKKDAKVYFNVLFPKKEQSKEVKNKKRSIKEMVPMIREIKTDENKDDLEESGKNLNLNDNQENHKISNENPINGKKTFQNGLDKKNSENDLKNHKNVINDGCDDKEDIMNESKDWQVQDENNQGKNYQNIEGDPIMASRQKNFEINLNEVMILKSSLNSSLKNIENKDLSKKENHDDFFDYYKYDDKIKYDNRNNQKSFENDVNADVQIKPQISITKIPKNLMRNSNTNNSLKIRVSFMAEKKSLIKMPTNVMKRESKIRRMRNFSFKNRHILIIDDKYFLIVFSLFSLSGDIHQVQTRNSKEFY